MPKIRIDCSSPNTLELQMLKFINWRIFQSFRIVKWHFFRVRVFFAIESEFTKSLPIEYFNFENSAIEMLFGWKQRSSNEPSTTSRKSSSIKCYEKCIRNIEHKTKDQKNRNEWEIRRKKQNKCFMFSIVFEIVKWKCVRKETTILLSSNQNYYYGD